MRCEPFSLGEVTGFICGGRRRRRADCSVPGCSNEHTLLCDQPITGKGRTCDAKLCARCTKKDGARDLCPPHAKQLAMSVSR